jgi:PAS domain S-box-containing protein
MQRRTSEIESRIKAVDESGISSVEFEPDGTIISANDNFLHLMGYSKEEVQGKHHRIFVPEKEANSEAYKQFWTDLATGKMHSGEFERVDKNGNKVFLNGSYSIIKNSEGKTERILKLATDITEIKLGQFELRAQAEQMQEQDDIMRDNIEKLTATQKEMQDNQKFISDLIDATDDNIFTVDRDHKILLFNKAFRNVWEAQGVHVEKGLSINEIFDESEIKAHSELIDKALRGEKMSIEVDKMIGGNSIRIHVTYSSIRNEIGEIIAAAIFAKNMSEG